MLVHRLGLSDVKKKKKKKRLYGDSEIYKSNTDSVISLLFPGAHSDTAVGY